MKKSHLENKETVTQGFFDGNKSQILNRTIDNGNRFATINNSTFFERDHTDPGMRVNVSQRRWI